MRWLLHYLYESMIYLAAPKITYEDKLNDVQKFKAGQTLILMVNISAEPSAKVKWSRDGTDLFNSGNVSIETTSEFSRLTVKGSSGTDTGAYKVEATNEVGSADATFNVVIRGKCSRFSYHFPT